MSHSSILDIGTQRFAVLYRVNHCTLTWPSSTLNFDTTYTAQTGSFTLYFNNINLNDCKFKLSIKEGTANVDAAIFTLNQPVLTENDAQFPGEIYTVADHGSLTVATDKITQRVVYDLELKLEADRYDGEDNSRAFTFRVTVQGPCVNVAAN